MKNKIIRWYPYSELIFADGFDDAILGATEQDCCNPRVIYSVGKCIDRLMNKDNMSYTEAREYFEHNVSGAYIPNGPIWCWDLD